MSAPQLTKREHVLRAVGEFNRLGGKRFREKYGYGPAKMYYLVVEGNYYDSKAIAGVAHGHEHPDEGFLKNTDFNGGRGIRRKLEQLGFAVEVIPKGELPKDFQEGIRRPRNPPWERDELLLALDLYLREGMLDDTHSEVQELSALLNRLPLHPLHPDPGRFRNPNGVALKLANFSALDPSYPGVGMRRGGRLDAEVWDEFAGEPERLIRLALAIRGEASLQDAFPLPPVELEDEVSEGRLLFRRHRARERSPALVRKKKSRVLSDKGRLACEVCDFEFGRAYGEHGNGFIECHHLRPLAESGSSRTRLSDLALVCSNCHRMLHRGSPPPSLGELRALME